MFDNLKKHESDGFSTDSAKYGLLSKQMGITIGVASVLISVTLAMMFIFADTLVAELTLLLFSIPIVGMIVFGLFLSGSHMLARLGMKNENLVYMISGTILTVLTYGSFGGAVLTRYATDLYISAVSITSGLTITVTIIIGLIVFGTDKSFEHYWKYTAVAFVTGVVFIFIGTFFQPLLIIGFVAVLIGFLLQLTYEIWRISENKKSPLANGFGLYVAFLGVFVHLLQIVLEILARR